MMAAIRASAQPIAPARGWAGLVNGPGVEEGRHTHLAAGRRCVTQSTFRESRGEAEAIPCRADVPGPVLGREVERNAEVLEQVAVPQREGRLDAVLDDAHAGPGHHDCGHCRDVHGVRPIATGADDIRRPRAPCPGPAPPAEVHHAAAPSVASTRPAISPGVSPLRPQRDRERRDLDWGRGAIL
jgi:hypothetical protein